MKTTDWWKYDHNTMVSEGFPGMFDNIVEGDLVALYVTVDGVRNYNTTIGGTASAVRVTAYVAEVFGSSD
ncbi:hypothetical protein [Tessaracoccus aquimaris]|uniref:hypothetical protein n=1 Tax=Tessaracoccus aquimaris TaxID=1332264 RepID=UPI0011AB3E82|nr:hypothetical protein [Tessaracoccus aquimaris]